MYEQMRDATIDALEDLRPARLFYGQFDHFFGLEDTRDPVTFDEKVRVLKAFPVLDENGSIGKAPIATIVQWAMHPEVTLGYRSFPFLSSPLLSSPLLSHFAVPKTSFVLEQNRILEIVRNLEENLIAMQGDSSLHLITLVLFIVSFKVSFSFPFSITFQ